MNEHFETVLYALVVMGVIWLMVWSLMMQRKGLAKQQNGLSSVEESLALSRRCVELAEESVKFGEQSLLQGAQHLKNQEEIIRLLGQWLERPPR